MPDANDFAPPRRKIDPGLIAAIVVGCIVGGFVVRRAATTIPNRPVGGLASRIAGDIDVEETPEHTFSATGDVRGLAYAADGASLFVGDREGLTLRDAATGKVIRTYDTEENGVRTLAVSPGGSAVAASLSYLGEVRFYPADSGDTTVAPLMTFHDSGDQEQQALAFTPDGNTLTGGGYDKRLHLWRAEGASTMVGSSKVFDTTINSGVGNRLQKQSVKLSDNVNAVACSPDGKTVAVATGPKVTLVDLKTGKAGDTLYPAKETVTALAFAANSTTLAAGLSSGNTVLLDTKTGRNTGTVKPTDSDAIRDDASGPHASDANVVALAYSRDGKVLISLHKNGYVQTSAPATQKALKLYADSSNDRSAVSLALSPDNKTFAVGYTDGTIRTWKR